MLEARKPINVIHRSSVPMLVRCSTSLSKFMFSRTKRERGLIEFTGPQQAVPKSSNRNEAMFHKSRHHTYASSLAKSQRRVSLPSRFSIPTGMDRPAGNLHSTLAGPRNPTATVGYIPKTTDLGS